jgi:hypothetical protein
VASGWEVWYEFTNIGVEIQPNIRTFNAQFIANFDDRLHSLLVTSIWFRLLACAAISVSRGPIGVPFASRSVLIIPYSTVAYNQMVKCQREWKIDGMQTNYQTKENSTGPSTLLTQTPKHLYSTAYT